MNKHKTTNFTGGDRSYAPINGSLKPHLFAQKAHMHRQKHLEFNLAHRNDGTISIDNQKQANIKSQSKDKRCGE